MRVRPRGGARVPRPTHDARRASVAAPVRLHPSHEAKITTVARLARIVARARRSGKRVVAAVGSFNILMYHHARFLAEAAGLGDMLVVLTNSDRSLQSYKNRSGRYVALPASERMGVLAGLACVDFVAPFANLQAHRSVARIRPDILARGGDYSPRTLPRRERELCGRLGIELRFTRKRRYTSTAGLIGRIAAAYRDLPGGPGPGPGPSRPAAPGGCAT